MRKTSGEVVTQRGYEYLCFVLQPSECLGVEDAVPVSLELGADRRWRLWGLAALAGTGLGGVGRESFLSCEQSIQDGFGDGAACRWRNDGRLSPGCRARPPSNRAQTIPFVV